MHTIDNIKFHQVGKPSGSFMGFVSFVIDGQIAFNECSLHRRRTGLPKYRVVYPENKFGQAFSCPVDRDLQTFIDEEISGYLIVNNLIEA